LGRRFPLIDISFDERDAARAGISNLTGVTRANKKAWFAVNPSIMSEAGNGTVELLAPVLSSCRSAGPAASIETTEQREARCFTASPLGCLVQFTHSGNSAWDRW
jgi:hypothetical protein